MASLVVRTTVDEVKKVLGSNYGAMSDGTFPDLTPYVRTAANIVARVKDAAFNDDDVTLTVYELEMMERWLAAHFYTVMDPVYLSRSTISASGSFATDKDRYKEAACSIDPTGTLRAILAGNVATAIWMGKPVSVQTPYRDRN